MTGELKIKSLFVKNKFRNLKRFGTIESSKGFKYQTVNELDKITRIIFPS
jgi:hypothetical protein